VPQFEQSLLKYSELRTGHDANSLMGHVLNNDNLNLPKSKGDGKIVQLAGEGCRWSRQVFFSAQKKFGFITDTVSGEEYFVHGSAAPAGTHSNGDSVISFEAVDNQGRNSARRVHGDNASCY
jgi:cold shock CspA family protein